MKIKKILSFLIAVSMVLSMMVVTGSATATPTITASSASAAVGETAAIDITALNNPGIVIAKVQVKYDATALKLTKVEDKGVWAGKTHSADLSPNPYTLFWNAATAEENNTATGVLATLSFEVLEGAAAGDYPIEVIYKEINNYDGDEVEFETVNGKITVPGGSVEPPVVEPTEPTITASTVSAAAGETATIDISAANNPGIVIAKVQVKYDATALKLTKVEDKGVWEGKTHSADLSPNPYTLFWNAATAEENNTAAGVLATLSFEVLAGAAAGDYPIEVIYKEINNYDGDEVEFATVNGKITVTAGTPEPPVVETYNVVFKAEGHEDIVITKEVGQTLAVADFPAVPEKQYCDGAWDVTTDITAATTVTAVYTRRTFTVTFKAEGAEDIVKTVNEGDKLAVADFPAVPAKEGYTAAWNVTTDITAATTVTAVYTKIETPEPPVVDPDAPTITASAASAAAGETATIDISAANNPGIVIAKVQVKYDATALKLTKVEDKGVWEGKTHSADLSPNPYTLFWNAATAEENNTAAGVLATLSFEVLAGAAAGDYPIEVIYKEINNYDGDEVEFATVNGKITVTAGTPEPPVVETYNVVFKAEGHEDIVITKEVGQTLAVADFPAVPEKQYCDGAWDVTTDITAATTVTAVYTRRTFTVTFKAEGAEDIVKTVNEGDKLAVADFPAVPAKEGYTAAWNVTTDITAATTVTAVYTKIETPEPPVVDPDAPTITASAASAAAGETATIDISAANNPGIVIAKVQVKYDATALKLTKVEDKGVWEGKTHSADLSPNPYTLFWNAATAEENNTAAGVLATLSFEVLAGAAAGDYPIEVIYKEINNYDGDEVEFATVNGKITVTAGTPEPPVVETYNVVFKAEGHEDIVITKEVGQTLAVADFPAVPEKQYCDGAWDVTTDITAATTVTAVYTRRTFTVTFKAEGAEDIVKTVNEGDKLAVADFPAVPAKEGYTAAWDVTTDITAATTVTAVYTKIETPEPPVVDPDAPTITASAASAAAGETVAIDISAANNPGIVIAKVQVKYDATALKLTKVEDKGVWEGKTHSADLSPNPYTLFWNAATAEENNTAAGVLATLSFEVLAGAAAGDYPIEVIYKEINNYDGDEVEFATVNGKITVTAGTPEPPVVETYNVVFKAEGHEDIVITKEVGQTLAVADFPAVPEKQYCDGAWDVTTDITAATTVTAVYTRRTFTVTFKAEGAEDIVKTVNEGDKLAVADFPAVPEKQYCDGEWDVTTDITAATTVTAVYTRRTFTVTFKAEGAEDIVKTVNEGDKLAVADFPAVPAKDGFTGAWDVTEDITEAKTVNAVYTEIPVEPETFVVTFVADGQTVATFTKEVGQTLTTAEFPEVPAKDGFTGVWDVTEDITEAKTVNAVYTEIPAEPEAPSNIQLSYTVASTNAEVKVTADANNSDITSVEITVNSETKTAELKDGAYVALFTGLTRATTYDVAVSVTNGIGTTTATGEFTTKSGATGGGGGGSTKLPVLSGGDKEDIDGPVVDPEVPVDPEKPVDPEVPVPGAGFVDVKDNAWYNDSVDYVVENGLMNGVSGSSFAPNANLTRAMLVTVLYRAEGEPAVNRSIPFADVDLGAYYGNAVIWAKQNGIVNGVDENNFAPDRIITREQVAAILYRYASYKGMVAVDLSENLGFVDADEISEYAISAMNWAVGQNLIKGYEDNTVRPANNITRAEMAAVLQRYLSK